MSIPVKPSLPGPSRASEPDAPDALRSAYPAVHGMVEDPERLLRELARVAELLRSPAHGGTDSLTAVVRLVPGLDLPRWQAICGQCDGWFALPLGREDGDKDAQDPVTGMLTTPQFMERLTVETEQALLKHRALSLALFEICGLDALDEAEAERAVRTLSSRLWEAADRRDIPGRVQPGRLALAMPSAGQFQALAMAERVVDEAGQSLRKQGHGVCVLRAGVAAMAEEGGAEMRTAELLEHVRQALGMASAEAGATVRERVKLYRTADDPAERETLVLASEKHFLFFGGM